MPGDYRKAMSQQVTQSTPVSHTPLHILCNGSDANFDKKRIVQLLVENGIVPAQLFATLKTDKVTVLLFFVYICSCET